MWVWVVDKIDNRSTEWMAILDCNVEFCAVSFGQTPINNIHACTHTYIFFLSLFSLAKSECINLSICQNRIVVGFFFVYSLIYSFPSLFLLQYSIFFPLAMSYMQVYFSGLTFFFLDLFCSFQWTILTCMFVYIATILHAFLCLSFSHSPLGVCFFLSCMRLRHILVRQYHRIVVIVLLYCCCYFVISYRPSVCACFFPLFGICSIKLCAFGCMSLPIAVHAYTSTYIYHA